MDHLITGLVAAVGATAVITFGTLYPSTKSQEAPKPVPVNKPGFTQAAGLEWHNSLDAAVAQAKRENKTVFLLSMFGRIDEAMPCANARTMRQVTFSDPKFHEFAKDHLVLAWEMVRPVPRVEIDFGKGKHLVRTVRGNAVSYLVNEDGRVFDAFPGIYTAKDFLDSLSKALDAKTLPYKAGGPLTTRSGSMVLATVSKSFVESPTLDIMGARDRSGIDSATLVRSSLNAKRDRFGFAQVKDASLKPGSASEVFSRTGIPRTKDPREQANAILETDTRINLIEVRPRVRAYFDSLKVLPTPLEAREAILGDLLKIPYKDPYMGLRDVLLPGTSD